MPEALEELRWHVTSGEAMDPPWRDQSEYRVAPPVRRSVTFGPAAGRGPMGIDASDVGDDAPGGFIGTEDVEPEQQPSFSSDEAAARYYLEQQFLKDDRAAIRALVAPDRPARVPDLTLVETVDDPATGHRVMKFQQTLHGHPVFGSRAVVELDRIQRAVCVDGDFARPDAQGAVATLSPKEALVALDAHFKLSPETSAALAPPTLAYYRRSSRAQATLVYRFLGVGLKPRPRAPDHGLAPSPRSTRPRVNVMVNAHTGRIVFTAGASPNLTTIPVECEGEDEDGVVRTFWGFAEGVLFELRDPVLNALTFDLRFADVDSVERPADPLRSDQANWGATARAAVSAHVNGVRVLQFFNSVFFRDGIDGKDMPLVSVVNCTFQPRRPDDREWRQALWLQDRMVYGQALSNELGRLTSYARFLDIIAHEITHGVIQHTSGLAYRDETGALNESFSDIFAILIKNWDDGSPSGGRTAQWNWEIGRGLAKDGGALRDMRDPASRGKPDHMSNYVRTSADYGGVHANSSIHNKAAYHLLTSQAPDGSALMSPRDVAWLYYLTLQRLGETATFRDTMLELLDVAASYWKGNPPKREAAQAGIRDAYGRVGIA